MSEITEACSSSNRILVGWREWLALPDLGIDKIKAKIDTGARTSALHAFKIEPFTENGKLKVSFVIHPLQYTDTHVTYCIADVVDTRWITDSGGHKELRYVIQTMIQLGQMTWPIEMTLTNREDMRFRMLLGRTAMSKRLIVNPSASYLLGKP